MFGKRCTLCGGKLDGRNICTECGLNNNQSEKRYKVNQSSCDSRPMTHIHTDEEKYKIPEKTWNRTKERKKKKVKSLSTDTFSYSYNGKSPAKGKYSYQKSGAKKKWGRWVVTISVIISILGAMTEMVEVDNIRSLFGEGEEYESPYPYETMEREGYNLSKKREVFEAELMSGQYIVGVHIPAGNYIAEVKQDYDAVKVSDYDHGIHLYEYAGKEEENYLDDLRLFEGAIVTISTQEGIVLKTENAHPIQNMENPLKETYMAQGEKKVSAGTDFAPGVYDVSLIQGSGKVEVTIYDTEDNELGTYTFYLGKNNTDGLEYKNIIFPENAEIQLEDWSTQEDDPAFQVNLQSSPVIGSEDYMSIYEENNNIF